MFRRVIGARRSGNVRADDVFRLQPGMVHRIID
jgi:hypothetical protein